MKFEDLVKGAGEAAKIIGKEREFDELLEQGKYEEALKLAEEGLSAYEDRPAFRRSFFALKGDVLRATGRIDEAIEAYKVALKEHYGNPRPAVGLAKALFERDKKEEAIEVLETDLKHYEDPEDKRRKPLEETLNDLKGEA